MKYLSSVIVSIGIMMATGFMQDSFAAISSTPSSAAPIIGAANGQTSGVLTFNYEADLPGPDEVTINGTSGVFAGSFWSENVGWCTFNGLWADTAKLTITDEDMSMKGYAWCQNAGWIKFDPTGSIGASADVFFRKSTGKFAGFAWSENLGWIDMSGLSTDITPPSADNFVPFAANDAKTLTLTGDPLPIPIGGNYLIELDDWDDMATLYKTKIGATSFVHDFRQAKEYNLRITDPFGNKSTGTITVVANIPSETLSANTIPGAIPTQLSSSFATEKLADAQAQHVMSIKLRDTYGNPVVTVPSIGKTVTMNIAFKNNVDTDQVSYPTGWVGDAVMFGWSFGLGGFNPSASNTSAGTGDYAVDIASYAPTHEGYKFTSDDQVSLSDLSYKIESLIPGVGQVASTTIPSTKMPRNNLKFTPVFAVATVGNTDNWSIRAGYKTDFSATISKAVTSAPLTDVRVKNALDIATSNLDTVKNNLISYQNPTLQLTSGTEICNGFNETLQTFSPAQYTSQWTSSADCASSPTSASQIIVGNPSNTIAFSWKPTIILAAPKTSEVSYNSEISYSNDGTPVVYPSYARSSASNGTLANGDNVTSGSGVINQAVKIIGVSSGKNNFDVLQDNSSGKIGSLTRTDIQNLIRKNVALLTKWGVPSTASYTLYDASIPLTSTSWPSGKSTIIVKGKDLVIAGDISKDAKIKGIIVLKDDQGNGGNIHITKDVKNIAAIIYADRSIISGDGSGVFYSDDRSAVNQLMLQGSIVSDNTIGGASMTPLACPYNVDCKTSADNEKTAKRYDLNYFRFYDGTVASSAAGVPDTGKGYPFIIYYDSRLQTSPPPGFATVE